MNAVLHYGIGSTVKLDLPEGVLLAEVGRPQARSLQEPAKSIGEALRHPLSYPPLADATTPADRIVLALEPGVPQAEILVAEVIRYLVEAGVAPDGLAVLRTAADAENGRDDPRRDLPAELRRRIPLITHDPNDRGTLAYLAATQQGEAILLNRAITDADLAVPIGLIRHPASPGYHGVHGAIFPAFSDHRTQLRFRLPPGPETGRPAKGRFRQECDEVGWLLGISFIVEVVPGPGDEILYTLAGEVGAVRARGRQLYGEAWQYSVPRRASLVVATIEGGAAQQTWQNFGTALDLARNLVEEGGAIALCCELAAQPGPAVQQMVGARSRERAIRQIRKDRPEDVLPATQLTRALDRADVFLLSRLDDTMVEDLEMAPIHGPAELVRLAQRYPSCILVSNAPHAIVAMDENGAA